MTSSSDPELAAPTVGRIREDVAFLRQLADGGVGASARDGAVLAAAGVIFALVGLEYWAIDSRIVVVPAGWRPWLWLDGLAPFLATLALIQARMRGRPPGPGSRAIAAGWRSLGLGLVVAVIGLAAAGSRLEQPELAARLFPVPLFSLLAASWGVGHAVRRKASLLLLATGAAVAAIVCGALAGRPLEWLALAAGLALLVAAPGLAILRDARRA